MNPLIIFQPLKDKKSLKVGIISALSITIVYFTFSILILMYSTGFNKMPIDKLFIFSLAKYISMPFTSIDWIILLLFPIVGGLLFANYNYWKCKSSTGANVGLLAGLFATTCPACILPLLGLASFTTIAFKVSRIINISVLILLLASVYFIAYKQQKCRIDKK